MELIITEKELEMIGLTPEELKKEIIILMYSQGRLSSGQASKLINLNLYQFFEMLAERQVPINYDVDAFEEDLKTIENFDYDSHK